MKPTTKPTGTNLTLKDVLDRLAGADLPPQPA